MANGNLHHAVEHNKWLITLAESASSSARWASSAQFLRCHVWLPDAMEGPTPVSALIHRDDGGRGVYMLSRSAFSPRGRGTAATIIADRRLHRALAALIAMQQNDIKTILAYSTLSQLGYMVMAVGLAAPNTGMFHLTTHASRRCYSSAPAR